MTRVALVAVLLAVGLLGGCGGNQVSAYCASVTSHQKHLSEIVDGGDKTALIQALPDFTALEGKAPDDIRPDWKRVINAIEVLKKAVAGGDKAAIAAAATALEADDVATSLSNVQQQVRDVCHTPLTL